MSDRMAEIRTTLSHARHYPARQNAETDAQLREKMQRDIAWLLDEVERLWSFARYAHREDCASLGPLDQPRLPCDCGVGDPPWVVARRDVGDERRGRLGA